MEYEIYKKECIWVEGSKFFMELHCPKLKKYATQMWLLNKDLRPYSIADPIVEVHKPISLSYKDDLEWYDLIEKNSIDDTALFFWEVNVFHGKIESYYMNDLNDLECKVSSIRELGNYDTSMIIQKQDVPFAPSSLIKELEWWIYSGEKECRITIDKKKNIDFYLV